MLKWPAKAKRAIASFFVKWNDIDVYIEDTAKHSQSLYKALINRSLENGRKVDKVFPLGNRRAVLNACQHDQSPGGRPRLYLIDGDLDLLIGTLSPNLRRFYRHHVYAIENYLVCENAVADVVHEEYPEHSLEDIIAKFDFKALWSRTQPLHELFVWFALSKDIAPHLPTINLGLGFFLTKTAHPTVDGAKVTAFCAARKAQLESAIGKKKLRNKERAVRNRFSSFKNGNDSLSAKDFLIPLVRNYANERKFRIKALKESLELRLAKLANLTPHRPFVAALREASRARY